MNDSYIYIITALLPLAACMLVLQNNPYDALVIRGILGAVAAMLYAIFGAADVALTEALVGTLLSIMLYAVAVRSSLVMRLGVLENELIEKADEKSFDQILDEFRRIFGKRYMRLEVIPYIDRTELQQALLEKEIHAICTPLSDSDEKPVYETIIRLPRLYEIIQNEISAPTMNLTSIIPSYLEKT